MNLNSEFSGDWSRRTVTHPRSLAAALCSPDAVSQILEQITAAFEKRPDVANVLHGQRRIRQGGKGRRTALFASKKSGGAVPVESKLELAHAVALERSPTVLRFRTQAIQIALTERTFACPDFLVEVAGGTFEIHEVKPSIVNLTGDERHRFERIEHTLRPLGIGFRLIDARTLASGYDLNELLLCYTRGHAIRYSPAEISLASDILTSKKPVSFSEAYQLLKSNDLPAGLGDFLNFHGVWSSSRARALRMEKPS
ncbi:MAG TPA: hypothetical protein VGC21_13480 [Telluria sp.]|jgi:hypothetical protein